MYCRRGAREAPGRRTRRGTQPPAGCRGGRCGRSVREQPPAASRKASLAQGFSRQPPAASCQPQGVPWRKVSAAIPPAAIMAWQAKP